MFGVLTHGGKRNLVRAEGALDGNAVDFLRARPALGSSQDDHRPRWARAVFIRAGLFVVFSYLRIAAIESCREKLVHDIGVVPFDKIGTVAMALEERGQFFVTGACHHGGTGDFITVEMQNRQYGPVSYGIQKLDTLPTSFERAGFGLAIADNASHDQVRIVEGCSEGVDQRVAEFASLMHRVRCMRSAMTGDTARRGKRAEEKTHAVNVLSNLRMNLGVSSFKIRTSVQRGSSVAGARDVDNVCIRVADQAV